VAGCLFFTRGNNSNKQKYVQRTNSKFHS
jgi:hypothetical protein